MRTTMFIIIVVLNICVLSALFGIWWINGKEDTWLYLSSAAIVLTSFLYISPPKQDKVQ